MIASAENLSQCMLCVTPRQLQQFAAAAPPSLLPDVAWPRNAAKRRQGLLNHPHEAEPQIRAPAQITVRQRPATIMVTPIYFGMAPRSFKKNIPATMPSGSPICRKTCTYETLVT